MFVPRAMATLDDKTLHMYSMRYGEEVHIRNCFASEALPDDDDDDDDGIIVDSMLVEPETYRVQNNELLRKHVSGLAGHTFFLLRHRQTDRCTGPGSSQSGAFLQP